ncbi:KUP/HAK/KT family potassium transporter [Bradyrhizobium sp. STM 3562]|uniref:KUP/HAK/KT family potassium transporter n=1 Tax=Bradyrhizobium sp. STM 3562 TaxID=578924 RepID=UPI00388F0910
MNSPGIRQGVRSAVAPERESAARIPRRDLAALTIGAIGVVYGDIGTSPLYAIDQIFFGAAAVAPTQDNVLGAISLALWTIILIVAFKYALLVLRAENDGEGGLFALYGLLHKYKRQGTGVLLWSLMLGAGLLLADAMITPAISVLSAVEGLEIATPALSLYIIPITAVLLTGLFAIQFKGASGIAVIFGPLMLVWFAVIAALGAVAIAKQPAILAAFNPGYGIRFLAQAGLRETMVIVGILVLVVTGSEAMYADLGHFGARPIRIGWFAVTFPALVLNYLGQGAQLLSGVEIAGGKLFYSLVPSPLLLPMVALATLATIVASQALISGAFSLVSQAIGLGLVPRLDILHTHRAHAGQIYIPVINWGLYAGCIALVVTFGSSSALASALALAVAGVMLITSLTMFAIARYYWKWSSARTALVWGPLTALSGTFLLGGIVKLLEGGIVPLSVAATTFLVMATWRWGRKATFAAYAARSSLTMAELVQLHRASTTFIERNALIMAANPLRHPDDPAPALVSLLLERYGILPRNLILVQVTHPKIPYVHNDRYHITVFKRDKHRGSVIGVELRFGFMEEPNVERYLESLAQHREIDLPAHPKQWIVHVAHENLLPARHMNILGRLRFRLFLFLRRVSRPTYYTYHLGNEVQLSAEIMPVRVR